MKKLVLFIYMFISISVVFAISFKDSNNNSLLSIDTDNNIKTYKYNKTIIVETYSDNNLLLKREVKKDDDLTTYNYIYNKDNKLIQINSDGYSTTYVRKDNNDLLLIVVNENNEIKYYVPTFENFSEIEKDKLYSYNKISNNLTLSNSWEKGKSDLKPYKIDTLEDKISIYDPNSDITHLYNEKGQVIRTTTKDLIIEYEYKDNKVYSVKKIYKDKIVVEKENSEILYDIEDNILEKIEAFGPNKIKTIYRDNKKYASITYDIKTGRTIKVKYY